MFSHPPVAPPRYTLSNLLRHWTGPATDKIATSTQHFSNNKDWERRREQQNYLFPLRPPLAASQNVSSPFQHLTPARNDRHADEIFFFSFSLSSSVSAVLRIITSARRVLCLFYIFFCWYEMTTSHILRRLAHSASTFLYSDIIFFVTLLNFTVSRSPGCRPSHPRPVGRVPWHSLPTDWHYCERDVYPPLLRVYYINDNRVDIFLLVTI